MPSANSRTPLLLFLVSVVQHFDQAIFQLETLVKQTAQLFEFFCNALAGITQVVERQQLLGDDIDARVNRLCQVQATLIVESLGLFGQLLVDTEVPRRDVIHQYRD